MYKTKGTAKLIKDTVQVTEKFSKREFVLLDNSGMYEQEISFQFAQDKCSLLDGFSEGDQVEVSWNLNGRSWTSPQGEVKYFNTLQAWRIEKVGATHEPNNAPEKSLPMGDDNDLPF